LQLGAQLRFQALAEERQPLKIETISRSGDDMIGLEIEDPSILPGHLQLRPRTILPGPPDGMI